MQTQGQQHTQGAGAHLASDSLTTNRSGLLSNTDNIAGRTLLKRDVGKDVPTIDPNVRRHCYEIANPTVCIHACRQHVAVRLSAVHLGGGLLSVPLQLPTPLLDPRTGEPLNDKAPGEARRL